MTKKKLQDVALSITKKQLANYILNLRNPTDSELGDVEHFKCFFCHSGKLAVKSSPDDDKKPLLVAQPIPFAKNLATWYFPVVCANCGNTIFFDAQVVTQSVEDSVNWRVSDDCN